VLPPGSSTLLTATVLPATADQAITWSLLGATDATLTPDPNDNHKVTFNAGTAEVIKKVVAQVVATPTVTDTISLDVAAEAIDIVAQLQQQLATANGNITALVDDTVRLHNALQAAQGTHDTVTVTVRDTVTSTIRDTVTVTVRDTVTSTTHDTVTVTVRDTVTSTIRDTITTTIRDTVTIDSNADSISSLNARIAELEMLLNACQNGSSATAVETLRATSLQIYPNPTTGLVYIDNPTGAEAEVYTLGGGLVLRTREAVIDLSQHAEGAYIIKVGNKAAKVVKQ
jgi:hypothetical protein